jgi:hypothetical protein
MVQPGTWFLAVVSSASNLWPSAELGRLLQPSFDQRAGLDRWDLEL